jgi:hypothetical protein
VCDGNTVHHFRWDPSMRTMRKRDNLKHYDLPVRADTGTMLPQGHEHFVT